MFSQYIRHQIEPALCHFCRCSRWMGRKRKASSVKSTQQLLLLTTALIKIIIGVIASLWCHDVCYLMAFAVIWRWKDSSSPSKWEFNSEMTSASTVSSICKKMYVSVTVSVEFWFHSYWGLSWRRCKCQQKRSLVDRGNMEVSYFGVSPFLYILYLNSKKLL